jgi:spore maturation protein CgeB
MKILFVGNLNEYTRTHQRYQAMRELGYEVNPLSTAPIPWRSGIDKLSLWCRVMNKLGYPPDRTQVNEKTLQITREQTPDLIWIEKGLMVKPRTLKQIKRIDPDIVLVFYSTDNMIKRHNQSAYFRGCLSIYDWICQYAYFEGKNRVKKWFRQMGAKRLLFTDGAYDRDAHRPLCVTKEDPQRLGADVVFVGSFEVDRARQMLYLAQNGVPVRVWGGRWEGWQDRHPNLTVEARPIYGRDYAKALCASKIALGFLRKMNDDLQTGRTMEIPACGTFMLAERTRDHLKLFEEGKEAEFFDSKEELLEKVRYYLQHDDERERIAKAGRKRCVESGYSHHDRLKYMLDVIRSDG